MYLCRRTHGYHFEAKLLVRHRPFDVGLDVARCVVDLVLRLRHARWILSPRYRAPDTPEPPMQTGALSGFVPGCRAGSGDSRRLRRVERVGTSGAGKVAVGSRPRVQLPGAGGMAGRAREEPRRGDA